MGEIKSVKVDNWGVFFLQKLQNFFNKTDYCDLTLQFRDNSQLKVHRLVLSACTDYFNVLEQTCEVVDDAIIMPNGLQADVVVPIVNFMYTGTLEFELKMYNRLLRTAKDMNMTVLLKLLEAHRRTMEMHPPKLPRPASPKQRRKIAGVGTNSTLPTNASGGRSLIQINQGKRLVMSSNALQNRNVAASNTITRIAPTGPLPVRQIGSTTFTRIKIENEQHETNASSSTGGSGYSIIKHSPQQQATSPFEQLRKGYNSNKRPAVSTFVSPPAKKPNLEDVKEFAEQQRMRKQIAAEYGDDDYDASNIMDDDTIHNDDDDDEMIASTGQPQTAQTSSTSASAGVQTVAAEDPPGTTTIIVKHEGPDKPPTIVVKDNSNSKMNHAKIISEVLRQYPHLVRSNKNIKLKIMPNGGGQAQKIVVKKEILDTEKTMQTTATKLSNTTKVSSTQQQSVKTLVSNIVANRPKTVQNQQHAEPSLNVKTECAPEQVVANKATTGSSNETSGTTAGQPQKRRIDSKTMHALIALGAENTTGPWLCLRCGRNGHPISIPSYRGFRRHLINTHKEVIDSALCEHCGWRSPSKRELHFHMQLEHKIKTNLYIFPECQLCLQMCIDSDGLNQHLIDSHPDENKQQCIYCNKIFPEEIQLYTHMKTFHKKHALEDGIIDYSDEEIEQEQKEDQLTKKIKILSDISLPIASSIIKTDSFVQQQEMATSATPEEYLQDQEHDNTGTKFVAADGSEVILTPEQRKEILSQLNQEHDGGSGVVMVLNDNQQQQQYASGGTQSDQGAISQDETSQATTVTNEEREPEGVDEEEQVAEEDDQHDNQIYNEMKSVHSNLEDDLTSQTEIAKEAVNEEALLHDEEHEQEESVAIHDERAEHLDESKESIDNLEWAENLISEQDMEDEVSLQTTIANTKTKKIEENKEEIKDTDNKSQDEISKKLKELTGDWSEDDDEDMQEEPLPDITQLKEMVKEKRTIASEDAKISEVEDKVKETEKIPKKEEENKSQFEDHAELMTSLQNIEKEESNQIKTFTENIKKEDAVQDTENIDEDDIDMALKSLHKEDLDVIKEVNQVKLEKEESLVKDNEAAKNDSEKFEEPDRCKPGHEKSEVEEDISLKVTEEKIDGADPTKDVAKHNNKNLIEEIETIDKPEAISSTSEVDEETKKDLLDSLLSEQVETMEKTGNETLTSSDATTTRLTAALHDELEKVQVEAKEIIDSISENNPTIEEEFLNETPEKEKTTESPEDDIETKSNALTTAAETATGSRITDFADATTGAKEESNLTSEDRVKSLISEWGDDEDDEDNDTDLTANL